MPTDRSALDCIYCLHCHSISYGSCRVVLLVHGLRLLSHSSVQEGAELEHKDPSDSYDGPVCRLAVSESYCTLAFFSNTLGALCYDTYLT